MQIVLSRITALMAGLILLIIGNSAKADTANIVLPNVSQLQNDNWSCGIQSSYRVLQAGFGAPVDYFQMRSTVTSFNPFRIVVVPGLFEFSLNHSQLQIGQSSTQLAESLRANYRQSARLTTVETDGIKDLVWNGIPVLALIQRGISGGGVLSGCLGVEVFGSCLGFSYNINTNYPLLHWIVVVGYDPNGVYYYDTNSNTRRYESNALFESKRNWTLEPYSTAFAAEIERRGTRAGQIIYFNEPLTRGTFTRTGERYPNLTLNTYGFGRGTIVGVNYPAANCAASECVIPVLHGRNMTLQAIPDPGSEFVGWAGACTGMGACSFTMSAATRVQAKFRNPLRERPRIMLAVTGFRAAASRLPGSLSINVVGSGHVVLQPGGTCQGVCQRSLFQGTSATILAVPKIGYYLESWGGACAGQGQNCTVTVGASTQVHANFSRLTQQVYGVTVSIGGSGAGTVTSSNGAINCGQECVTTQGNATSITLQGVANAGSTFAGWGGDCQGLGECVIGVDGRNYSIEANFNIPLSCSFSLLATKEIVFAGANTSSLLLAVANPCAWTINSSHNWAVPSVANGSGSSTIGLSVTDNFTGSPRSAQITVSDVNGSQASVTVTQSSALFYSGFE